MIIVPASHYGVMKDLMVLESHLKDPSMFTNRLVTFTSTGEMGQVLMNLHEEYVNHPDKLSNESCYS